MSDEARLPQLQKSVWVVESGDYEQRGIDLIADSLDAAIAAIKSTYSAPYVVAWEEPKETMWPDHYVAWQLCGEFEQVPNYSIRHRGVFDITQYKVATLENVSAGDPA